MINYIAGKKAAFLNLGCKVNAYETEAMQQLMKASGVQIVSFEEPADLYIVNTCTVTNIADRKSRQMLHRAKHKNPQAIVVAAGCYVQAAGEELLQDQAVDLIIGNNRKNEIVPIMNRFLEQRMEDGCKEAEISAKKQAFLSDLTVQPDYEQLGLATVTEKTRAYIKVQDGCNQFCSYCIIPFARGRIRSRSIEDVVGEVTQLAGQGYKEIVLTGIHLSSYGLEGYSIKEQANLIPADGTMPLFQLIEKLSLAEGIERIRLGSLEPRIITEQFVKNLSSIPKLCPHFHLSLQSGCDETLQRMNRKYSSKQYLEACDLLRAYFIRPAITTDVIVGFPGETDQEFETTEQFLEQVSFAQMHIFKFSARKGTKAELMPDQVLEQIKNSRSDRLLALSSKLQKKYEESGYLQIAKVLFEDNIQLEAKRYAVGYTERYEKTAVCTKKEVSGQILPVTFTGIAFDGMQLGTIIESE